MQAQRGFSLIEVLVTVFILSIGLLGVAALQTNALRFGQDGYLRSVATLQANDIADRMRANQAGVSAGSYNSISGAGSNPSCSGTCTSAQIAARDHYQWNLDNANLLPSGEGQVAGNNGTFTVTVYYDAHRTGATGKNCGTNPNVDLACVRISFSM